MTRTQFTTQPNRREGLRRISDTEIMERIERVESSVERNAEEHAAIAAELAKVSEQTRSVANNTAEIVTLFRGVASLRSLVLFMAPLATAVVGVLGIAAWVIGGR